MKLLVTGGTVFASRYTAEYFIRKSHEVYVLNRNSRPQSEGVKLINADRRELGDALKSHTFDYVIDVTAYNAADVKALTSSLREFGGYIMVSSSAVYPETNEQPFTEEQKTGFNTHWETYGTNKIDAEEQLLRTVPSAYIIRPPYFYGKMNNLCREAFVFECAEADKPFFVQGDGSMKLQFFDIEDMCRFIERLMEVQPGQHIFNVGNTETVTVSEWVRMCYAVLGKTPDIRSVSEDVDVRAYFPFRNYEYVLDVSRMAELMPELKPLETGLKESFDWWKAHHELVVRKDYTKFIMNNLI